MAEQNAPEYPPALELEKELTRKERQIEYLQTELRRYHNLMEELKQGMRPIGTVVLSPTKGVIVDVIERMRDRSLLEYQVEKAPKVFYEDIVGLGKELLSLRQAIEWILDPETRTRREQIIRDPRMLEEAAEDRELRNSLKVARRICQECQRGIQAGKRICPNRPVHRRGRRYWPGENGGHY